MAPYNAGLSADGHQYNKGDGLRSGLPTYAVITPESKLHHAQDVHVHEAIVVGAGYSGLIAARDLVKAGMYFPCVVGQS